MEKRVLIINGSYKDNGISEQMVNVLEDFLKEQQVFVKCVNLREKTLQYCDNCRTCMQIEGIAPATCHLKDDVRTLVETIEQNNTYVFISPTNMGSVTALFKCFMERLSVYGYWPWGEASPRYRKKVLTKKALCLSSCAAPSFLGWLMFDTMKLLRLCAKCVGAEVVGCMYLGLMAKERAQFLSAKEKASLRQKARKLLA